MINNLHAEDLKANNLPYPGLKWKIPYTFKGYCEKKKKCKSQIHKNQQYKQM